jgi:hypothetical protein
MKGIDQLARCIVICIQPFRYYQVQLTVPGMNSAALCLSKGPPGRRARLRGRTILGSLVSDSARTGAARTCTIYLRVRLSSGA